MNIDEAYRLYRNQRAREYYQKHRKRIAVRRKELRDRKKDEIRTP